jgi:hypothetical protein
MKKNYPNNVIVLFVSMVFYAVIHGCSPLYSFAPTDQRITLVSPINNPMTDVDINQAIIQLGGNRGVISLTGTFIINQPIIIVSNVFLIGEGIDKTILQADSRLTQPVITNKSGPPDIIDSNITIANLTIIGNKDAYSGKGDAALNNDQPFGIWFTAGEGLRGRYPVKNVIIKSIFVRDIAEKGIVITGKKIIVDSCAVFNVNWDGIQLTGSHITLTRSSTRQCGDNGVEIERGKHVRISHCSFSQDSTSGLFIRASQSVEVEDCISQHNVWRGFYIGTLESTEQCNNITLRRDTADSNGYPGIVIESAGTVDLVFLNNNVVSRNISNPIYGNMGAIHIEQFVAGGRQGRIRHLEARDNRCFDNFSTYHNSNSAFFVKGASRVIVVGNQCYDTRSAKKQKYGYYEEPVGRSVPDWNTIQNNDFSGCLSRSPQPLGSHSRMNHNLEPN